MDKIKVLKIILCVSLAFLVTALLVFAIVTAVSSKDESGAKSGKTSEEKQDKKTADNTEAENKTDDKKEQDESGKNDTDNKDNIITENPTEKPTEEPVEPDNTDNIITPTEPDNKDNIVTPVEPDKNDNIITPVEPDDKDNVVIPVEPDSKDNVVTPVEPGNKDNVVTPIEPDDKDNVVTPVEPDIKDIDPSEIEGVESEYGGIIYHNPNGNGLLVCIDPGHQTKGNYKEEPVAPGSSETKPKVSSGTSGVSTKLPEYKLNLTVSLQLRDELLARGYDVVMTRIINDVDITNIERAMVANDNKADVFIRVHANSADSSSIKGMLTISPTSSNKYVADIYSECYLLSECVLKSMESRTGSTGGTIWKTDTMSGINWSKVPVTIVEMGYMSNPDEDRKLSDPDYQKKIVEGMADGIDDFFMKR